MTPVVGLLLSAAVAALLAPRMLRALPTRPNWVGRELPFPGGVAAAAASVLSLGGLAAAHVLFDVDVLEPTVSDVDGSPPRLASRAVAALLLGVALLGLADDLLAGESRGWRGHARAVLRGEMPTGLLKAAGTLALATAVLAGSPHWLLSVLLVSLTTNLFNILDLRPGRTLKVFVVVGVVLAATGEWLRELGPFVGPVLVVGLYDLRMRTMLGDTGSNLIGALAGVWLVFALDATGEVIALAVIVAITVYGELRSITRAVEALAPLRWVDRLGRPQDAASSRASAETVPTLNHPDRDA